MCECVPPLLSLYSSNVGFLYLFSLDDSEEASELRAAVQDLETQIEEQKLKIQNTPNQILRVSVTALYTHTHINISYCRLALRHFWRS